MKVLSLFSGGGLGDYGLELAGMEIVGQVEIDKFWTVEPGVGRVAHGVANRLDRLKLLGNGQVVQVVRWIGERIMEFDITLKAGER